MSPFNTSTRSLGYSRIPIEQQTPLRLSARIRNNGTAAANNVTVEASITVGGGSPSVINTTVAVSLAPLADTLVSWETGFMATSAGEAAVALTASVAEGDEETSDNNAVLGYTVTSTADGNHAMALDNDLANTSCGTDNGFLAGNRFELIGGGSSVQGISVRFGVGTSVGSRVNALILDGGLNLLTSSATHTVSEDDLALSSAGGSVYIALDSALAVPADRDVFAVVRCQPDSGFLRVACGGAVPQGAALVVDASTFQISYPASAPIVRIHLSQPITGISPIERGTPGLVIYPVPSRGSITVVSGRQADAGALVEVLDGQGRRMLAGTMGPAASGFRFDTSAWPSGVYCVRLAGASGPATARLIVD